MSKQIDYLHDSTIQILKKRFDEVKERMRTKFTIKLGDFREFALDKEPLFNCPEGWEKIQNAWYGKKPDIRVTELIQEYEKELNNLQNN